MSERRPQAYLINPVRPEGKQAPKKESRKMATKMKRRKLAGAALKAHLKKVSRKAVKKAYKKAVKVRTRTVTKTKYRNRTKVVVVRAKHKRARHIVKRHHRKGGRVHSYQRKGAFVKKHLSNPFGLGKSGAIAIEMLQAVGILLGTVVIAGFINKQVKRLPMLAAGYPNLGAQLAVAGGLTFLAGMFLKNRELRKVAMAGAFVPPAMTALAMFAPALASQVALAEEGMDASLMARLDMQARGQRDTELDAQLQLAAETDARQETDSSSF